MAQITFQNSPVSTTGTLPETGSEAPDFTLCTPELEDVELSDFPGQYLVLNILPSLDTHICQSSARSFDQLLPGIENLTVANVSMDLPFAQSRFCSEENLHQLTNLSAFRNPEFGRDYGVVIVDGPLRGLFCRAVILIGPDRKVLYTQLVHEICHEPEYEAVLNHL